MRNWLNWLVVGSIVLPTMLYGAVIWQDRQALLRAAEPSITMQDVTATAVLERWRQHVLVDGGFFLATTAALLLLALIASKRTQQLRDCTDELKRELKHRESVEGQLGASQKLEAMGQIAGQIAHDFGNVLTIVLGCLDRLENDPSDQKVLRIGQRAANRGILVVQALLAFARRETHQTEICDLDAVLSGLGNLLRQAIGEERRLEIQPSQQVNWVRTDRAQMELAIFNIAVNARDAMPRGGLLRLSTCLCDPFVTLAMQDNGTGMPAEVLTHACDPFFSTKQSGTGLGLSVVYSFAEQSGGRVTIDSMLDHGTTVTLWLPIYKG